MCTYLGEGVRSEEDERDHDDDEVEAVPFTLEVSLRCECHTVAYPLDEHLDCEEYCEGEVGLLQVGGWVCGWVGGGGGGGGGGTPKPQNPTR